MVAIWSVKGKLPAMLCHGLGFAVPRRRAAEYTLCADGSRVVGSDNLQRHPPLIVLVVRKPDGGEAARAELVHDSVASAIVGVAQVDRMETTGPVLFHVFRVADALGEKKAQVVVLFRVGAG